MKKLRVNYLSAADTESSVEIVEQMKRPYNCHPLCIIKLAYDSKALPFSRSQDPRVRFAEQFDARDFFGQCPTTIGMPLIEYCDPTLNFSVRYIYLWCGRLAEMLATSNSIEEGEFEWVMIVKITF